VLDRIGVALPDLPDFRGLTVLASDEMERGDAGGWSMPAVGADTLAFLQYTSGSTGDPKGVMLTHGNLLANLRQLQWGARLRESVNVSWLPLHHDMGLIGKVLSSLFIGGRLVFMSPGHFLQRPMRWMRAITRYRGNVAYGPDFAYRMVLRAFRPEDLPELDLSHLHTVGNGAEPVRADTLDQLARTFAPAGFRPEHIYPAYGLAEASVLVSMWHPGVPPTVVHVDAAALEQDRVVEVAPEHPNARALVGCGIPADDLEVVVADPATGEHVGPGRVGEMWIAGPNVSSGYWRKPELNAEAFGARTADGAGPYYRTGDLGFRREGVVFITGRLKDLIIIDGRNHYPQDVERTVEEADEQLRPGGVAAFSVEVDGIEQLVVVAEVDRRAREIDAEAVAQAIRGAVSLAHEIAPREVVLIKAGCLPKTSSGKVRRRACRSALEHGELQVVGRAIYAED
jgi:acyl-CoA synthetase (AMP-forming)/AMP-acid ligase II